MGRAGTEAARFFINSTLGGAGFFDVADPWFGLKEHDNDFGLTLGHYSVHMGPYIVLPLYGPSSIRDTVGRIADGAMNPMSYTLAWYITLPAEAGATALSAINYRSLNMTVRRRRPLCRGPLWRRSGCLYPAPQEARSRGYLLTTFGIRRETAVRICLHASNDAGPGI